jgi:membrane associated rhomboid family serine protease
VETGYQTCYRHPDHQAGVICQRCDRPICPQCMHQASVGFHCPECTKQGAQKVYRGVASLQARPILTQVLIAVNVAVFAIGILLSGAESALDGSARLINDFGLAAPYIYQDEYYRLITSGFLHAGIIHIALNMWVLWIFGRVMEQTGTRAEFGAVYGVSLLSGSLGALIVDPGLITVGASGAIFGLAGALLMAQRAEGVPIMRSPLLGFLVINAIISVGLPDISWGGHMGGFIGGAITGWAFYDLGRKPATQKWVPWAITAAAGVVLVLACISVSNSWVNEQLQQFN